VEVMGGSVSGTGFSGLISGGFVEEDEEELEEEDDEEDDEDSTDDSTLVPLALVVGGCDT